MSKHGCRVELDGTTVVVYCLHRLSSLQQRVALLHQDPGPGLFSDRYQPVCIDGGATDKQQDRCGDSSAPERLVPSNGVVILAIF